MNTFKLEIITPQRRAFEEDVAEVSVPTQLGTIGVLAHHEPLFCSLVEGEIKITSANKEFFLSIGGGFMEVAENKVSILVSRAVHADELNESEIKQAQEAAKIAVSKAGSGADLSAAQAMLRRSILDLKVYKRKHKHASL